MENSNEGYPHPKRRRLTKEDIEAKYRNQNQRILKLFTNTQGLVEERVLSKRSSSYIMLDEIFEHKGKKYRRLQNIYDSSNCGKCVFKDYNKCDEMHNHCYDDDTDVEFFFEETK